jgi:hypothetical protein
MTAGRHRSFDKDKTLEKAMLVFWGNGSNMEELKETVNFAIGQLNE